MAIFLKNMVEIETDHISMAKAYNHKGQIIEHLPIVTDKPEHATDEV